MFKPSKAKLKMKELFFSIIIPAVISFLVSYITYKNQKRIDFNYDYRKHILDKRKEAYALVERAINSYHNTFDIPYTGAGRMLWDSSYGPRVFDYQKLLEEIDLKNVWYTQPMLEVLDNYKYSLKNTILSYSMFEEATKHSSDIGQSYFEGLKQNFEEIDSLHNRMLNLYFVDIIELDDIDGFRKSKLNN